jgi:putative NADPH-quinone reductase
MPKKTLVILAHPDIARSRVNKRWAEELRAHSDAITVHNIYEAYPDRKIDVAAEQKLVEAHDRIIFQFPIFWFSTPAFLKLWIDEVLTYGWAFGPGGDKLKDKEIGLAFSTGGKGEAYQAGGQNRFAMSELTKWLEATAIYVGAKFLPSVALHGALYDLTDEDLAASAKAYAARLLEGS